MRAGASLVAAVVAVALVAGCGREGGPSTGGRLRVVTSLYPLYDVTRDLAGPDADVSDLTPPGAEPHDLELSPADLERLLDADLAIVLGGGFQPAVERAAKRRDGPTLVVLDALPRTLPAGVLDPDDPHVWLDPVVMRAIATVVDDALGRARPESARAIAERRVAYTRRLTQLDQSFRALDRGCPRSAFVTTHDAFGYLARRYGFEVLPVAGRSPEGEPDPEAIDRLARTVRDRGLTTVFTEPLVSRRVAATIARESGARVDVLDPVESLTAARRERGDDYVTVMLDNRRALARSFGCP